MKGMAVPTVICLIGAGAMLALAPPLANAKGGGMLPKPNKDFRELIVRGERPEIAACLAAAIDYARRNPGYSAIRWDDDASDRAIMRENDSGGELTRTIRLTARMRVRSGAFAEVWRTMEVSCVQPESGVVSVSMKSAAD
jgi:hypothetical protein